MRLVALADGARSGHGAADPASCGVRLGRRMGHLAWDYSVGAGDGNRTRTISLGTPCAARLRPGDSVTLGDLAVLTVSDRDGPLLLSGTQRARCSPLSRQSLLTVTIEHVPDTARKPGAPNLAAYTRAMSEQREELFRLVEELPEEEVPAVLDDVRRHLRSVRERPWLRPGSEPEKALPMMSPLGLRTC